LKIHKQPVSAVFYQKSKQSWQKQNKLKIFEKTERKCYKQQHYSVDNGHFWLLIGSNQAIGPYPSLMFNPQGYLRQK
jgi:hypothetical protein